MLIKGALQLRAVFLAGWTMAAGRYAESGFAGTGCAFGFNGDIAEPFGDAQEGFFHKV
jgi:hypothetical protein